MLIDLLGDGLVGAHVKRLGSRVFAQATLDSSRLQ